MSSTTESQIKYAGNGVQVLFTFPFTYLQPTDIYVSLYNQTERRWDDTTEWTFANATTIQFTTAPPTATGEVTDNIRIQRRTNIDPLAAQFNPGSAIRASDLNDDFEQLQLAIIDNTSALNNLDLGVTSLTTVGDGLSVDQSTGNVAISNTGVTAVNGGTGVSVDQTTGNTTISNTGVTSVNGGTGVAVDQSTGDTTISNTGVTEITAGDGISIDQSTGNVTITNNKVSDVTSVNGQTGDVSLDINDLTDVDTESPGHIPLDGQALTWDAGMNHWMPANVVAVNAVPEAPEDDKIYGRENATWVVIADGETGPVLSVNDQTGAVRIGVEDLVDFKPSSTSDGTRPVSEAYPTYVPENSGGFTEIAQWSFTSTGPGQAYAYLCSTAEVLTGYRENIQLGDEVTFQYYITNIINGNAEAVTETHPILESSLVTPVDGALPYMRLLTQCTFQALNQSYPLIFTHDVPNSGSGSPDGSVLQWDDSDSSWTPNLLSLNSLEDVDTASPGHVPTDGQSLVWNESMGHWMPGVGTPKVEELADFAYYPAANEVTLLGPNVDVLNPSGATNSEYETFVSGDDLWVKYLATNTAQNAVFEQLQVGDEVTACYYTSNIEDNSEVYVEVSSTFKSFGPNNNDPNPTVNRLELSSNLFSVYTPRLGDYPMVIKSPFISNGFKPITTGQALIYDQTTESWRPEDVSVNTISATAPAEPIVSDFWTDISVPDSPTLKVWDGTEWLEVGSAGGDDDVSPPVINNVVLSEVDPTGNRFTSESFNVSIDMLSEGAPLSQKGVKGGVTAEFPVFPSTNAITAESVSTNVTNNGAATEDGSTSLSSSEYWGSISFSTTDPDSGLVRSMNYAPSGAGLDDLYTNSANDLLAYSSFAINFGGQGALNKTMAIPLNRAGTYFNIWSQVDTIQASLNRSTLFTNPYKGSTIWYSTTKYIYGISGSSNSPLIRRYDLDGNNAQSMGFSNINGSGGGFFAFETLPDRIFIIARDSTSSSLWYKELTDAVSDTYGWSGSGDQMPKDGALTNFNRSQLSNAFVHKNDVIISKSGQIKRWRPGEKTPLTITAPPTPSGYRSGFYTLWEDPSGLLVLRLAGYVGTSGSDAGYFYYSSNNSGATWVPDFYPSVSGGQAYEFGVPDSYLFGRRSQSTRTQGDISNKQVYTIRTQTLTVPDGGDLDLLNVNDIIRASGVTDFKEFARISSITSNGDGTTTLVVNGFRDLAVGETIEAPPSPGESVIKRYLVIDATGNVITHQAADPGFTFLGPGTDQTITFPAIFPSGQTPDEELPPGTYMQVEVEAENVVATDDYPSNIVTPIGS